MIFADLQMSLAQAALLAAGLAADIAVWGISIRPGLSSRSVGLGDRDGENGNNYQECFSDLFLVPFLAILAVLLGREVSEAGCGLWRGRGKTVEQDIRYVGSQSCVLRCCWSSACVRNTTAHSFRGV